MSLTLTVLRCPGSVAPETRSVSGGEFSIGRGPDNDWVLQDPDRHLSKRHCVLAFRSGGWQLADLSTNGTWLNREAEPVGHGEARTLRDGDRLRLGPYEIELRIAGEAAHGILPGARRDPLDPFATGIMGGDPFQVAPGPAAPLREDPLLDRPDPHGHGLQPASINLPADYDPLAPDPAETPFAGPTQPDHTPLVEDAFRPPPVAPSLLPDDWDLDLSPSAPPQRPREAPEPGPRPAASPPPPAAEPASPPVPKPPEPARPTPERSAPERTGAERSGAGGDPVTAFLRGAGLPDARPADPAATMEALGAAFRAMVAGLRQALIARAAIKGEFRIEQTIIRRSGNNPLKFSAGDDDALAALLGVGRRTDMGPEAAITEALRDIRVHEVAVMAAMQSAVRTLLARLDPAALRRHAEQGGVMLVPSQRKVRAWDAFEALHTQISEALTDDFDSVFGKAFARAYEQALHEAGDREDLP